MKWSVTQTDVSHLEPISDEALGIDVQGLREAKLKLRDLELRETALKRTSELLRQEFRDAFPRGTFAVYLSRCSDLTLSALRWRECVRTRNSRRRVLELDSDVAREAISELSPDRRKQLLDFEHRRVHLNYAHKICVYQQKTVSEMILRLEWRRSLLADRQIPAAA